MVGSIAINLIHTPFDSRGFYQSIVDEQREPIFFVRRGSPRRFDASLGDIASKREVQWSFIGAFLSAFELAQI
mgnify:CR=1 FL=1